MKHAHQIPTLPDVLAPDAGALLRLMSVMVDDELLGKIAVADHGWKADECLEKLKEIRKTHTVPAPLDFHVQEVLQLSRWSNPADERGHLLRAFCCATLIAAGGNRLNCDRLEGENINIALLLESLAPLPSRYQEAAVSLFSRRLDNACDAEDPPFFLLAILLTSLAAGPRFGGSVIDILADFLLASETAARNDERIVRQTDPAEPGAWLVGLTYFDQCEPVWRSFAERLRLLADLISQAPIRAKVRAIAGLLAPV